METHVMLQDESNFEEWHSQLKRLAIAEGVWNLVTGTEKLPREPITTMDMARYTAHMEPKKGQAEDLAGMVEEIKASHRRIDALFDMLRPYKDQNNRALIAHKLIEATVEPELLSRVGSHTNPNVLYNKVLRETRAEISRPFNSKFRQFHSLCLRKCAGIDDYLGWCNKFRRELDELHPDDGKCDDTYFIAKLIAGLPREYEHFVETWELFPEQFRVDEDESDVDIFCDALLREESEQLRMARSDSRQREQVTAANT